MKIELTIREARILVSWFPYVVNRFRDLNCPIESDEGALMDKITEQVNTQAVKLKGGGG